MNKTELIDALAGKSGLTKADAGRAVDGVIETITEALAKGESVTLVGFGTFAVGERAARVGRNPQTGAEIQISASKQPKFSAGSKLKDAVNK
ncbi:MULTISPECIES: HU family DNA-binding protein [Zoogloea]|jgi:DNA-binding protein HU-beta|uniref:HU family DNA-binding protein n=1 Tax=Zoogloea oleivorans TaxID=1552750 RepID=A0A6C2CM57_9RHOO|nr:MULTISPECIES: HU family DNA-binding protein [Zoogloea]MBT9496849.1 HU family DNA-binding protein [Zoogloea sp.]MDD2669320.1 HU family DNA-binding protein [Zoogloea sp.]MDY0034582.1 HU family DNA-binding protein [Zoogloea oleivorans]TYC54343.1 HU family DNA-binding protein [Zoogloea oleivorans]